MIHVRAPLFGAENPHEAARKYVAPEITATAEGTSLNGHVLSGNGLVAVVPIETDDTDANREGGVFPVISKMAYACAQSVQGKTPRHVR